MGWQLPWLSPIDSSTTAVATTTVATAAVATVGSHHIVAHARVSPSHATLSL